MNLTKYLERFDRLHHLIGKKSTGTPAELAEKLDLSKRAVYEYIRIMREWEPRLPFAMSGKPITMNVPFGSVWVFGN